MDALPLILVVEDDPATRALLEALVRRNFCEAVLAADGREALYLLARHRFDAVILDLLLPEVSGFDLLRHLRSAHADLLPAVIVVSAAAQVTTAGCEELRHVARVLPKPFDVADIDDALRACVLGKTSTAGRHARERDHTQQ